jgi:hypothetical protein
MFVDPGKLWRRGSEHHQTSNLHLSPYNLHQQPSLGILRLSLVFRYLDETAMLVVCFRHVGSVRCLKSQLNSIIRCICLSPLSRMLPVPSCSAIDVFTTFYLYQSSVSLTSCCQLCLNLDTLSILSPHVFFHHLPICRLGCSPNNHVFRQSYQHGLTSNIYSLSPSPRQKLHNLHESHHCQPRVHHAFLIQHSPLVYNCLLFIRKTLQLFHQSPGSWNHYQVGRTMNIPSVVGLVWESGTVGEGCEFGSVIKPCVFSSRLYLWYCPQESTQGRSAILLQRTPLGWTYCKRIMQQADVCPQHALFVSVTSTFLSMQFSPTRLIVSAARHSLVLSLYATTSP